MGEGFHFGLLLCLSIVLVVIGVRGSGWRIHDPLTHAFVLLSIGVLLRPIVLGLGFDTAFPDRFFSTETQFATLRRAQEVVVVWLVVFVVGNRWLKNRWNRQQAPADPGTRGLEQPRQRLDVGLTWAVTLIAMAVAVPRIARSGGVLAMAAVVKSGRQEVSHLWRSPALVAAYLGAGIAGYALSNRRWTLVVSGLGAYVAGAGISFAWGARDAAVFPLALLVLAGRLSRSADDVDDSPSAAVARRTKRRVNMVLYAACLVPVVMMIGFGLRTARDQAVSGSVSQYIEGQSSARKLAVALNNTQFDALMLVVRDGLHAPGSRLTAVTRSLELALPSPLRLHNQVPATSAVSIAQTYEPQRRNGWPATAVGDWYFTARWLGVVFGAALSSLVCRLLQLMVQRASNAGHQLSAQSLSWMWGTTLAPGGVWLTTPARALMGAVPILVAVGVLRLLFSRSADPVPIAVGAPRKVALPVLVGAHRVPIPVLFEPEREPQPQPKSEYAPEREYEPVLAGVGAGVLPMTLPESPAPASTGSSGDDVPRIRRRSDSPSSDRAVKRKPRKPKEQPIESGIESDIEVTLASRRTSPVAEVAFESESELVPAAVGSVPVSEPQVADVALVSAAEALAVVNNGNGRSATSKPQPKSKPKPTSKSKSPESDTVGPVPPTRAVIRPPQRSVAKTIEPPAEVAPASRAKSSAAAGTAPLDGKSPRSKRGASSSLGGSPENRDAGRSPAAVRAATRSPQVQKPVRKASAPKTGGGVSTRREPARPKKPPADKASAPTD